MGIGFWELSQILRWLFVSDCKILVKTEIFVDFTSQNLFLFKRKGQVIWRPAIVKSPLSGAALDSLLVLRSRNNRFAKTFSHWCGDFGCQQHYR